MRPEVKIFQGRCKNDAGRDGPLKRVAAPLRFSVILKKNLRGASMPPVGRGLRSHEVSKGNCRSPKVEDHPERSIDKD